MVRAVIGDESHVEAFVDKALESGTTLQVGLAIGRFGVGSSSRDAVLALIPTPQSDGLHDAAVLEEEPRDTEKKKKGGAKGKVASQQLKIDMDWVAEHARQVSKMLVGGISVVGIYIITTDILFKNSAAMLWQTAKLVSSSENSKHTSGDVLILHFSYSPRRVSCRSCSFESNFGSSSLHPCDWKLGRVGSTLSSVGCSYNFEIRLPVAADTPNMRSLDIFMSAISLEASRLKSAMATMDGVLVSQQVSQDKFLAGKTRYDVELFLPFDCGGDARDGEIAGLSVLSGSVQALSYYFPHDSLSCAVADLKADIIKSLRSRLEILYDEVDPSLQDGDSFDKDPGNAHPIKSSVQPLDRIEDPAGLSCKLPYRVFVPWHGIFVCDYMQEGETLQDLNGRCMELLKMEKPLTHSEILELEAVNSSITHRSFEDVIKIDLSKKIHVPQSHAINEDNKILPVKLISSRTAILSLIVILVAFIAAYFLTTGKNIKPTI